MFLDPAAEENEYPAKPVAAAGPKTKTIMKGNKPMRLSKGQPPGTPQPLIRSESQSSREHKYDLAKPL